jgi:hypothetical protein
MMSMAKNSVFDPRELRPVRELIADGSLPFHIKTVQKFCRDGVIAASKIGNDWRVSPAAIRNFYWQHGNKAFRETHR